MLLGSLASWPLRGATSAPSEDASVAEPAAAIRSAGGGGRLGFDAGGAKLALDPLQFGVRDERERLRDGGQRQRRVGHRDDGARGRGDHLATHTLIQTGGRGSPGDTQRPMAETRGWSLNTTGRYYWH